jgi:hypothetical protein
MLFDNLLVLYIISILGSFSIGYALLRIGFPEFQEKNLADKILYGYLIGLIISLPSIISIFFTSERFFFLFFITSIAIVFIIMQAIRVYYKKEDTAELNEKNSFGYIPKKVLTKEEKERIEKDKNEKQNLEEDKPSLSEDEDNYKEIKAKEFGASERIKKVNNSVTGNKEHGLVIKGYDPKNNQKKVEANNNKQEQIFKEKEPNVIGQLRSKISEKETKSEIVQSSADSEEEKRKKALESLKGLAKGLKKKKSVDEDDELESIHEIDDDF